MKPIQSAIESLRAKSLCPRLHIDVTHADAVCPDFVRDKWKEQLVIDLDPSYPLDLAFTKIGVEADMSFGGYVTRCTFPWAAIYVVGDRATGRGQVFADNVPESLRHKFGPPRPPSIDPALTEVRDDVKAKLGSRRRKRRGAESDATPDAVQPAQSAQPIRPLQAISVVEDAPDDEGEEQDEQTEGEAAAPDQQEQEQEQPAEPEPPAPAQQTAQIRRSAFKVIDGGG